MTPQMAMVAAGAAHVYIGFPIDGCNMDYQGFPIVRLPSTVEAISEILQNRWLRPAGRFTSIERASGDTDNHDT